LAQLLRSEPIDRVLVFTRTKHGADKVVRALAKSQISAEAIHGNKSQNQRERVLAAFRTGKIRTLVATDIAARGIDVEGISHVVNFDLPNIPESYVHRIGRTARAGAEGIAISFCDGEERAYLRDIEKLIRIKIPSTDQRGVRHAAPPPVAGAVASPVDGDAAPAPVSEWSSHESPRANGHGKKQQQNRPRQNKPYQGRSEQGRSEHSRSEQPRKPHAAQPQQARNGDQQEQPQRNGQNHQQPRNVQHQPKRNGQHQQPRNGQPHQAKRNGHQHQQNRSPSQPADDGSIATVGFMKPTQRQKHHSGGLAARRSAR
jgi:ATP-dependent RNA helicase RhlE